ncbi:Modulator of FtsH protease YccA [compost metagenome]
MEHIARAGALPALSDTVRKTLTNTFITVGGMLGITAAASLLAQNLKPSMGLSIGTLVMSLVLIFAIQAYRKSGFGLVLLALFSGIMGVAMGPVIGAHMQVPNGGATLGLAFGATALATFSCAAYAITTRRDFSRWYAFLFGGLVVLLAMSIIGLFVSTPALHLAIGAFGSLLFIGWMLFDIGRVVSGEETSYISAALSIYLDILNFFLSVLRLLGFLPRD